MNPNFLDFEQPIAELDAKIQELRHASNGQAFNIEDEIATLQGKLKTKTAEIFRNLTPWQVAQLSRHPARPYTLDYLGVMSEEFHELAGDRAYADDAAIVGGLARIDGRSVMVIGHQKGRDTRSKVRRNFGMPRPEGYRKALRLMQMAERFGLPVLTFIDTPGAYPGVGAEERGQSEAIARNLLEMARLRVPIVCSVVGLPFVTRTAESPRPMPQIVRLPNMSFRVANSDAVTVQSRVAGLVTIGPTTIRFVAASIWL